MLKDFEMRPTNLTIQQVAGHTSESPRFTLGLEDSADEQGHSVSGSAYKIKPHFETWLIKNAPSTIQSVWQLELNRRYSELGAALSELAAFDEDDEWKIDSSVYAAASYVADKLKNGFVRVPQIFVHGPTSVVFNWSDNFYNFYLTIGANNISALLSSQERIMLRREFSAVESLNSLHLLPPIQSALLNSSGAPTSSVSDQPDYFG
jgi:hypothetical protein